MTRPARAAALALLVVPAVAAALPAGPPPLVAPEGATCAPAPAWLSTPRGDVWLTSPSSECRYARDPATGLTTVVIGDGPLVSPLTPRLVLRAGERVTLHVEAPVTAAVLLDALASPRAVSGARYRLSPSASTWMVRPGSGVLRFQVPQIGGLGPRIEFYAAVYRATRRPVVPGTPPPAVRRRTPLPTCGIERLRQGDDGSGSRSRACLADAIAAGRAAELISTRPTVEGDPITTIVRFLTLGRVDVIVDATADRFGARRWTIRTCRAIDPATLVPSGCRAPRAL